MALTTKKRARRQIQYSTRFSAYTGKIRLSVLGDPFFDWTVDAVACPAATSVIYQSASASGTATPACPHSKVGAVTGVNIPAGAHESIVDQATADAASVTELGIVKQYIADTTGTCNIDPFDSQRSGVMASDHNSFDVTVRFQNPIGTDVPAHVHFTQEVFMSVKVVGNIFVNITRWVVIPAGGSFVTFTESVPNILEAKIVLGQYKYPVLMTVDSSPLILT